MILIILNEKVNSQSLWIFFARLIYEFLKKFYFVLFAKTFKANGQWKSFHIIRVWLETFQFLKCSLEFPPQNWNNFTSHKEKIIVTVWMSSLDHDDDDDHGCNNSDDDERLGYDGSHRWSGLRWSEDWDKSVDHHRTNTR